MTDLRTRLVMRLGLLSLLVFLPGERPSHDPPLLSPASHAIGRCDVMKDENHGRVMEGVGGLGPKAAGNPLVTVPPLEALDLQEISVAKTGTGHAVVRYQ